MNPPRISHGLAIHGGVGTLSRAAMSAELESDYLATLAESLRAGRGALDGGGSALDAVVAAVQVMEDSPLFNAGRGSNFDERGIVTMDASIMDGATQDAGAVAGVTDVRSPVELARLVMERSEHLMLIGEGAGAFARSQGVPVTENTFFHTERRWNELLRARERGRSRPNVLGDSVSGDGESGSTPRAATSREIGGSDDPADKAGTVGAVALDPSGRLAAATSTGGMANKTWGRVGDSPIIGAGTYASPRCAVSCTGWGEYFIRNAIAFDVHARMAHAGASLSDAVHAVLYDVLAAQVPSSGGMCALGADGTVELGFNTPGMYRGWIGEDGEPHVAIWGA
jgi:beta-aspartyl-peptidase (threonine type)